MAEMQATLPRVKKLRANLHCGFCGDRLDHPGSQLIYPVPGEEPHIGRKACSACAPAQQALAVEAGLLIMLNPPTSAPKRKRKRAAPKPKAAVPMGKLAHMEPIIKGGRITNRTKMIVHYLTQRPMMDRELLDVLCGQGANTTLVEVRDSLYRIRNQGKVRKLDDGRWHSLH